MSESLERRVELATTIFGSFQILGLVLIVLALFLNDAALIQSWKYTINHFIFVGGISAVFSSVLNRTPLFTIAGVCGVLICIFVLSGFYL